MSIRLLWLTFGLLLMAGIAQLGWRPPTVVSLSSDADPRCAMADRAAVVLLQPLMLRNAAGDVGTIERAVHALGIARKHCQYGWTDTALDNYAWLERWIAEHR